MRRGLAITALMAGFVGVTTIPAAAQGWGYAAYDEPAGVGVSVGFGAPAYGAYAANYYAPGPGYAYGAAPCTCGAPAGYVYSGSYSYARPYRPGYYAAGASYAYEPGYAYSSYAARPGYAYETTYTYGDRAGYAGRGARISARGEIREGARNTVRTSTVTRERSAARAAIRDESVGVGTRERAVRGTTALRTNREDTMRGQPADGRRNVGSAPQARGELRDATTGRGGGSARRMNGRDAGEPR